MNKKQMIAVLAVTIIVVVSIAVIVSQQSNKSTEEKTEVTVMQTDGTEKIVPYDPQTIVILNGYAPEVVAMLGCADRVVGVGNATYANPEYYQYYKDCTQLGSSSGWDLDTIVTLNPDLIIMYDANLYPTAVESIATLGIPYVFLTYSKTIEGTLAIVESLGKIFGKEDVAEKYYDYATNVMEKIEGLAAKETYSRSVLLTNSSLYGTKNTTLSYILAVLAGATNMSYNDSTGGTLSVDWVVDKNPDIIIISDYLKNTINGGVETIYDSFVNKNGLSDVSAVKTGDVYILTDNILCGARFFVGMVAIFNILYPDESGYALSDLIEDYNSTFGLNMNSTDCYYTE